jgi:zinc transport system substrate-binding protein
MVWASAIAQQLSKVDPANAATYAQNLEGLKTEITALEKELETALAPYKDKSFIVLHDAFQYFEVAFDVKADAFVFAGDGQTPGPKTVQNLREHLIEHPADCAFTAPQENDALMRTVIEGQGTRVAVLDPLGEGQEPYAALLRSFAENMAECFGAE